jgi:hypothetical protein
MAISRRNTRLKAATFVANLTGHFRQGQMVLPQQRAA